MCLIPHSTDVAIGIRRFLFDCGSRRGRVALRKPRSQARARSAQSVTFDTVRQFALALPGVEEGTSYGTPAFKVNGKLLARFHQDGESLVIKVEYAAREVLMGANPKTFYITEHYRCWPLMLVRIASVHSEELRGLLEEAWRGLASKRLIAAYDVERLNAGATAQEPVESASIKAGRSQG
jgi:hypothetical protein